jgi:hypothetical protein
MPSVPSRVAERLAAGLRRFQPILESAKVRDINESDTVVIVADILSEVFGYDKYTEITSECSIRGTWCDLGIKIDGKFLFLIEVKAIGLELKDAHAKQAVDYSANQGTDWVFLTNGDTWRVYKVTFGKPISNELVLQITLSSLSAKKASDMELLYNFTKEGWAKSAIDDFHSQRQALSRYSLAALMLSQPVLDVMRRELRRLVPDVRIDTEQIRAELASEVLKRDVIEGERAQEASRRLARAAGRVLRERARSAATAEDEVESTSSGESAAD